MPFLAPAPSERVYVSDVERSIAFYEALGFRLMKTHAPGGTLEFAELESTAAAKLMLARVNHLPERDPDQASPGFLYLYTHSLVALRQRLRDHGFEPGEITDDLPGRSGRCPWSTRTATDR